MLTIKDVTRWETSDGAVHSSLAMAQQHVLNQELVVLISSHLDLTEHDAQNIVNLLSSNAQQIREYLDACDRMKKEHGL